MKNVNQTIVETFCEVAEYLETGRSGRRPRLLLTGMGSEHGGGELHAGGGDGRPCGAGRVLHRHGWRGRA